MSIQKRNKRPVSFYLGHSKQAIQCSFLAENNNNNNNNNNLDQSCYSTDVDSDFDDMYLGIDADEYFGSYGGGKVSSCFGSKFSSRAGSFDGLSQLYSSGNTQFSQQEPSQENKESYVARGSRGAQGTQQSQLEQGTPIHIKTISSFSLQEGVYYTSSNNYTTTPAVPLATPPGDSGTCGPNSPLDGLYSNRSLKSILDRATNVNSVGEASYSCQSIAILTKAISQRSLPPSPPKSVGLYLNSTSIPSSFSNSSSIFESKAIDEIFDTNMRGGDDNTYNDDVELHKQSSFSNDRDSLWAYPSSILGSVSENRLEQKGDKKIKPQTPTEHKLIPINLDPVSPMLLATLGNELTKDSEIDKEYLDCAILDDGTDDENTSDGHSQRQLKRVFDEYDGDEEYIVSPEFLVGYEQDIISQLNLEEDNRIVDRFRTKPLLADGNRPFIPSQPVYSTVEELLAKCYPELDKNGREYVHHLKRLERNREKLRALSQCIDNYDQVRQKRLSQSQPRPDNRFRVRR